DFRLDAIQALIPRVLACELDPTCTKGGIVLVERAVELAHKAPLVLCRSQQRTVHQNLTDGRANNGFALTEVLVKIHHIHTVCSGRDLEGYQADVEAPQVERHFLVRLPALESNIRQLLQLADRNAMDATDQDEGHLRASL